MQITMFERARSPRLAHKNKTAVIQTLIWGGHRFSNYWRRLSRLWRILQIGEGVIHRSPRPRWITPSEICRILHILPGGVGHGPRDQFCPITSLQMADWFFHLCAGSLFDFLRFSPFIKWFTMIFFGKVWVDRCSRPQFLKQYGVCLFSISIVRCNSSCA